MVINMSYPRSISERVQNINVTTPSLDLIVTKLTYALILSLLFSNVSYFFSLHNFILLTYHF